LFICLCLQIIFTSIGYLARQGIHLRGHTTHTDEQGNCMQLLRTRSADMPELVVSNIKPLCPTRWLVRIPAIQAILQQYDTILSEIR
jgi:hypothetical protein